MGGNNLAVVLVSGGLDSCVTAALAAKDYSVAMLHATYGQRTAKRERKAFDDISNHYSVQKRMVMDLSHLANMSESSLTNPGATVEVFDEKEVSAQIPSTYVPFRNGNLLAAAISWGEALGAKAVFIGAVEADSSGYPDCRAEFLQAFSAAAGIGTKPETKIEIMAPLITWRKAKIIEKGVELQAPLHLTWSCYVGKDSACGTCESCGLRIRGFQEANRKDPIPYA